MVPGEATAAGGGSAGSDAGTSDAGGTNVGASFCAALFTFAFTSSRTLLATSRSGGAAAAVTTRRSGGERSCGTYASWRSTVGTVESRNMKKGTHASETVAKASSRRPHLVDLAMCVRRGDGGTRYLQSHVQKQTCSEFLASLLRKK